MDQLAAEARGPTTRGMASWAAPSLILLIEYLFISLRVDAASVLARGGAWRYFGYLGIVAPLGVVLVTAFLVLRPSRGARLPQPADIESPRKPWLFFTHVILFGVGALLTDRMFQTGAAPSGPAWAWLGVWAAAMASAAATLFLSFGHGIAQGARWVGGSLGIVALVAAAAWIAGIWSMALWEPLARLTLRVVASGLSVFFEDVAADPEQRLLGLRDFVVEVAPVCSGFEGIGLITVLLGGYLVVFRNELKFPRALLLLPLGVVSVWVGNCVRIGALMAIGAYVSESLAHGAFHSKAGWVVFSAVVLGVAALGHRSSFFSRRALADIENPSAAYLVPFVVFAATALLSEALETTPGSLYPVRVVVTAGTLLLYRGDYRALFVRVSWLPLAVGLGAGVCWVAFTQPPIGVEALPAGAGLGWKMLRIAGAILIAPVVEELAFRGYLQRWLVSRDFTSVSPRTWTWGSVLVTSVAFGLIHQHVVAGVLAGFAYGAVQIRSGRVTDAIVAHAVTNATLVVAVLVSGNWGILA